MIACFVLFCSSTADESIVIANPFVRESIGRQSMSEKRHGASKIDPASTATYMQILHQRQSSGKIYSSVFKQIVEASENMLKTCFFMTIIKLSKS